MVYTFTRSLLGLFLLVPYLTFSQTEGLSQVSTKPLLITNSSAHIKLPELSITAPADYPKGKLSVPDSASNPKPPLLFISRFYDKNSEKLALPVTFISEKYNALTPNVKRFSLPVALIGTGIIGIGTNHVFDYDAEIHEDIMEDHADFRTSIDDHTRFVPLAAVYGLNLMGIKGQHNLVEVSILALLTDFVSSAATKSIKSIVRETRPDGSSADAFPSGHTSSAFSKATILWLEYKDKSIWYGVGGYGMASATGVLRMLNKKHWFSDVLAGAGIGILSAHAVYAIYPWMQRHIGQAVPGLANRQLLIIPTYTQGALGLGMAYSLSKPNNYLKKTRQIR